MSKDGYLKVHDFVAVVDMRNSTHNASHEDDLEGPHAEDRPGGLHYDADARPCGLQERLLRR